MKFWPKICKDIPIKKTCQYNYKIKAIQQIHFEDTTQKGSSFRVKAKHVTKNLKISLHPSCIFKTRKLKVEKMFGFLFISYILFNIHVLLFPFLYFPLSLWTMITLLQKIKYLLLLKYNKHKKDVLKEQDGKITQNHVREDTSLTQRIIISLSLQNLYQFSIPWKFIFEILFSFIKS